MQTNEPITEHYLSIPELCNRLQTNIQTGLTDSEAKQRLKKHGPNQFSQRKELPSWIRFLKELFNGFSLLLWIGASLSLGVYIIEDESEQRLENLYITVALIVVIFVTGAFSFYQEGKSSKVMKSFLELIPAKAEVVRDGEIVLIDAKNIVFGDVITIKSGDQVPADMRVIESNGLKVDNSALTGESKPVSKKNEISNETYLEAKNLIFSATSVVEGTGKGIVLRTGDSTAMGHIANLTGSIKSSKSTLAKDLQLFMKIISVWAVCVGVCFFITMLSLGYSVERTFVFVIGVTVSSVPEGLIPTLTLCLTLAAKSMSEKNCLVKKLESVESLGATSIICSDKTGTLTQNIMTVANIWCDRRVRDVVSGVINSERRRETFLKLARCAILCSNAKFKSSKLKKLAMQRQVEGDATESAILKFMEWFTRGEVMKTRSLHPKVFEVPFNSRNKFQLSIHRHDSSHILVMKGAPEKILDRCTKIFVEKGEKEMTAYDSEAILEACTAFATEGKRVLAFCDMENVEFRDGMEDFEVPRKGLRFLGLLALLDPPRPNVPEAVLTCRKAGIKVIMVTGDHHLTAKSIARQVHIISEFSEVQMGLVDQSLEMQTKKNAIVLQGNELEMLTSEELDNIIRDYEELVFARTSPKQKLLIVESCQRLGGIVAVTGDGVNDSPALKKADIGIAMGISGSEVSKHAAEIVLLDDNFASVVNGIEAGRLVFDNLKKSISYILTHNIPELLPIMGHIVFGIPLPISVISILIIDLVTDMWPAVSFAYERPEDDLMTRKPRNVRKQRLVSFPLLFFVGQMGILEGVTGIFSYFFCMAHYGWLPSQLIGIQETWGNKTLSLSDSFNRKWSYNQRKELQLLCSTTVFATIVIMQLANAVICKSLRFTICQRNHNSSLKNGMLFGAGLTFILVEVPGIFNFFQFRPLSYYLWLLPLPFIGFMLGWDTWRKKRAQNHPHHWLSNILTF